MAAEGDSADDSGEDIPEAGEEAGGEGAEDMAALDKEISTEISDTGSDFDAIVPAIEQLTDAIKELKDSLGGVEPGEVSKNEFDEAEDMIGEAQGMEDEMYQVPYLLQVWLRFRRFCHFTHLLLFCL